MKPTKITGLILDMDGVLWRGKEAIGDLPTIFEQIIAKELSIAFATNNSTNTIGQYVNKLRQFGVPIEPNQILTSSMATAAYLSKEYPSGSSIYAIGEEGLTSALEEYGFNISHLDAAAVVVGLDRQVNYDKLEIATLLVRQGVPLVGTNPDRTLPTPKGLAPGAGSIIAAIQAATDIDAKIIGKPQPIIFQLALQSMELSPNEVVVVGDRIETDIVGGQAAGCRTALVLSGVTAKEMADAWSPPPDMVANNLRELVNML
jgi:4-nitrophenyl phosphatase